MFKPVTLVTLFRSYDQFYRAECITVSGFFLYFSHSVLLPDARWFDAQDGDVDGKVDVVPLAPYSNFAHVVFS